MPTEKARLLIVATTAAAMAVAASHALVPHTRADAPVQPVMAADQLREQAQSVATVDIELVYNQCNSFRAQMDKVTEMAERFEQQRIARLDEIESLQADLEILDDASQAYRDLQLKLTQQSFAARYFVDYTRQRLLKAEADAIKRVYQQMLAAIDAFADRQGIDVVLFDDRNTTVGGDTPQQVRQLIRARRVLFAANTIDATDDIIAMMNNSHP